jgi:iron complex outermembrane receptor protein
MSVRALCTLGCTLGCALLIARAAPAFAAASGDSDAPVRSAGWRAGLIEEVIVTARRREETLRDVPVSITAFSGPELKMRQINRADQLGPIVPNLEFDPVAPSSGSSSVGQLFIRGIGQTDFTPVTDPGVALYIDGVYLARAPGNVLDFVDIERIEVLRGPQGTLFGRNAIGGAIKVHTRRPDPSEFDGRLEARLGTDDLQRATLSVNQPFGADFAGNMVVYTERRDGYVRRSTDGLDTGDRDRWGLRAALAWDVSEALALLLTADATRIDENGAPAVSGGVNDRQPFATFGNAVLESCTAVRVNPGFDATPGSGPPTFPPPGLPTGNAPGCYGESSVPGPFSSAGTYPLASELDTAGVTLEVDWQLGDDWRFLSTTGLRSMDMFSSRDGDNTPANIFATRDHFEHEQLSQEFQLRFDAGAALHGVLGLYGFEEEGYNLVDVTVPGGALQSGGYYENTSWAAFGHGTLDFGDRWSMSLGLRYTEDEKRYLPDQFSAGDASMGGIPGFFPATWPRLAGQYLGPTGPLPAGTRLLDFRYSQVDFDHTDFSTDLRYRASDSLTLYLAYTTGYKSGGFDQRFTGPTPDRLPTTFGPEEARNLELGAKGATADGRLRWSLALFEADYRDLQIIVRETFNPLTVNAGEARIRGGEFEADWLFGDAWTLRLGVGYLDGRYTALSEAAQASGVGLDNQLVNAPPWSTSLGLRYEYALPGGSILTPHLDWSWTDEQYSDAVNDERVRQRAYHLLNLSLTWDLAGGDWQVFAALRNALDEEYLVTGNSAFTTAAAYVEQVWARPRQWQLGATWHFGP